MSTCSRVLNADLLRSGVSAMAICVAAPALAQTSGGSPTTQPSTTTGATTTPEVVAAPTGSANQSGVAEIVVTAQRRSQNLQNVPIAITAVTADSAKNFGTISTSSLPTAVPSLQFNRQPGTGVTPFLRGVGSSEPAGAEPEVAIYIDDVYIGNSSAADFSFNNIDSIAVLKGPQGTLFGRNATGGVIQVHTLDPNHKAAANVQAGYASYDTRYGNLYATTGLTDDLAVNFAATGRDQRDGYGHNLVTGKDTMSAWNYAFRGKLLWEPGSDTRILLSGDYSNQYDQAGGNFVVLPGTVSLGGGPSTGDRFGTYSTPNDFTRVKTWRGSGKITQKLGELQLVSITSYTKTKQKFQLDLDGNPAGLDLLSVDVDAPSHALSQELQLQSKSDSNLTWIIGAFYYDSYYGFKQRETGSLFPLIAPIPFGTYRDLIAPLDLRSLSAFADATWEFLPETKLTAGIRYTSDHYKMDRFRLVGENGAELANPSVSKTFSRPTWRAVLDHRFSPQILAYLSYSRGFKSGRFNVSDGGLIKPEKIDAYEAGLKTDLFDRKLRVNLAGFHYDYSNIQVSQNVGGVNQVRNAAAARINGVDLDATFVPSRRLNVTSGVSFLDAKYKSFPDGPYNVPNPVTCADGAPGLPPQTTPTPTGGYTTCSVELGGNTMPQAPRFTMSVAATYTLPTSFGNFDLNVSLYHNSGFYWEPDNNFRNPRYNLLNASLTWRSEDEKYEVRVYGRNLLDEYYFTFQNSGALGALGSPVMPVNFGGEVTVRF